MKHAFLIISIILVSCSEGQEQSSDSLHVDSTNSETVAEAAPELQSGDIIFQTSTSSQSIAIQMATCSKFSHCGIVYLVNDDTLIIEAIHPVRISTLADFKSRGTDKDLTILHSPSLNQDKRNRIVEEAKRHVGKDYDWYFTEGDDKLYCSELVYLAYKEGADLELCSPKPLKDYALNSSLVQKKLKERYGANIPMDRPMISPQDLFESEHLLKLKLQD